MSDEWLRVMSDGNLSTLTHFLDSQGSDSLDSLDSLHFYA